MLLAVWHIVRPIARVDGIIVEERERTLLNGGSSVPAVPITSARGSVWEDSILPVAVLRTDRLLADHTRAIRTGDTMRVVAMVGETTTEAGEGQTVGASLNNWLIGGLITFIIIITIFLMGEHGASLALVGAAEVLRCLRWWPVLCLNCV